MESHLPGSPTQARCSSPKDFVRGDMKPAPLRLSPKSKETDEASGVSQQQPGASFIENATSTDEFTTTEQFNDKLPRHPTQLKPPPLAAVVSKFEILDIMTDLETQATASHGASSVEVPRSPAENRAVRGVRTNLPVPTFSNYGITPQTQTPCCTLPRTKTWKLRSNDIEAPEDSPQEDTETEGSSSGFGPEPWMPSIHGMLRPQIWSMELPKHQTGQRIRWILRSPSP
ncbi:hypothetical protein BDP67DRAFT_609807 [Colletotrichum lupini]|nr:hypothetical protein BDP67DRAFT_609807 [Colletotrichum lupini]